MLSIFVFVFCICMQSIPKAFLEKELKGYKPIESVVLTTDYQPHRHWLVKVEGGRAFKEGWNEFCSHYGLKAGDFLVFAHQLNLMFQVSVFDPLTACHRSFSSSNHIIGQSISSPFLHIPMFINYGVYLI